MASQTEIARMDLEGYDWLLTGPCETCRHHRDVCVDDALHIDATVEDMLSLLLVCVDSPDDPVLVPRCAWHTCWQG